MQVTIDKATTEFAEGARKAMDGFEGNEYMNPDGSFKNAPKLKVTHL